MTLSCSCPYGDEWDGGPGDWLYMYSTPRDFKPLETSKRKRCVSCNALINIGAPCLIFPRYRNPYSDIEAEIIGFDWNGEPPIRIADHYHCEKCGEIFLNLEDLGYCLSPRDNMPDTLAEYHELTGFKKGAA